MNKKNLILGGILVVLIGLAFFYEGPLKEWREKMGQPDNFLASVQFDQVSKIILSKQAEAIILEKEGDRWKIGGTKEFYIKDSIMTSVKDVLGQVTQAEIEVVSENKEKKSEFQTDEMGGTEVSLQQGDTVLHKFVVGKLANDYKSSYISPVDTDKTYLVTVNMTNALVRTDWIDKVVFSSDKEKISKVRFQYPTREFTIDKDLEADLESENGQWEGNLPYQFRVDDEKMEPILNIMANLVATEIPAQTFDGTGLEKNLIIVQATGEEVDNILMVGESQSGEDKDDDLYFVKRGNSDNIYLITKEQRDELDQQIRDLR